MEPPELPYGHYTAGTGPNLRRACQKSPASPEAPSRKVPGSGTVPPPPSGSPQGPSIPFPFLPLVLPLAVMTPSSLSPSPLLFFFFFFPPPQTPAAAKGGGASGTEFPP